MATSVTQDNFEEIVLKATIPVVVDFWAPWCGPCKMQNPILDEFTKEMDGKALVAKVNVDEQQELAAKYNVMSIPTIKVFSGGEVKTEMVGVQTKEKLKEEVEKLSS